MKKSSLVKILTIMALAAVVLGVGFAVQTVFARQASQRALLASPIHPAFALLDGNGANVLESNQPLSTMKTCGQCHDTDFIASHSFHSDLGMSEQTAAGQVSGGQPWDTSPGLYGKWNPLTYEYLAPAGETTSGMDAETWVRFNAARIVGGGPAGQSGVEMNCFVCHLTQPDNNARIAAIQNGQGEWAATATLANSGIVTKAGDVYTWNAAAFTEAGELDNPYIAIQDPTNDNCAQCHGLVHTDPETPLALTGCDTDNWQTATTGQVISGQKISMSGMNLEDKASLARSWDIHAERGVTCTDCHYSLNNPAYYQAGEEDSPSHLEFDPRRLEIGEFLQRPDHNVARGQSAQNNIAADLKGTMRRCESCHNADSHASWLPYVERHLAEVTCETCHIPTVYAPAVQSVDWTILSLDGQPVTQCRGVADPTGVDGTHTVNDLVTGFDPVLMQRSDIDGNQQLAPYNLVSAWYWVSDTPAGPRPVASADLQSAIFEGGAYVPELVAALDGNGDGSLAASELRLDTPEKAAILSGRLAALGLQNPRIEAQVQPYSINHNVTRGERATRDCQACHSDDSRLAGSIQLAGYTPGGVIPQFVQDANTQPSSLPENGSDGLVYTPDAAAQGLYIFGHNRVPWVDWVGGLFFLGVLVGVSAHGGLRFYRSLRQPRHEAKLEKVYLYAVYERFWHWLQTFTIVLLLFTGLIIHRPDMFGWLSFRYMVTVHNVLAAILVINAGLSLFYHLASGEIQQFIPRPYGFFDQAIVQAKYYLQGIFKNDPHPFEKAPGRKMNPLQQATYFGILNVLLPLQIITGALMWGVQKWPALANMLGGLPFLAPFHSLVAWTFGAFIVGHVYLTTTGHEPLAGIKAMMVGWEHVETHAATSEATD